MTVKYLEIYVIEGGKKRTEPRNLDKLVNLTASNSSLDIGRRLLEMLYTDGYLAKAALPITPEAHERFLDSITYEIIRQLYETQLDYPFGVSRENVKFKEYPLILLRDLGRMYPFEWATSIEIIKGKNNRNEVRLLTHGIGVAFVLCPLNIADYRASFNVYIGGKELQLPYPRIIDPRSASEKDYDFLRRKRNHCMEFWINEILSHRRK